MASSFNSWLLLESARRLASPVRETMQTGRTQMACAASASRQRKSSLIPAVLLSGRFRAGNGDSKARDYGAKIASCTQRESPETGVSAIKAANSGYLRVVGKSLVARECVVADAVAVEPVSQTRFALSREKYREKSIFRPWIVTHSTRKPCAASVFDDCS